MSFESAVQKIQTSDESYLQSHGYRLILSMHAMQQFSMTSGTFIDVGGGETGTIFTELSPEIHYHGTECDLRKKFPYETDSFDNALCLEVIEHLSDVDFYDQHTFTGLFNLLTETYRVLKANGKVLFTTPNICSYAALQCMLNGVHPYNYHSHYREYTIAELVAALEFVGFSVLYANCEHVWLRDPEQLSKFDQLMDLNGWNKEGRGDDIFIICQKPAPGEGNRPTPQEAGKIISPQLRHYQGEVKTNCTN